MWDRTFAGSPAIASWGDHLAGGSWGTPVLPHSPLEPVRWMVLLSFPCIPGESANLGFPPLDAYGRRGAGAWSGSGGNLGKIYIFLPFAGYRRVDAGALGSLVPCHNCGRVT